MPFTESEVIVAAMVALTAITVPSDYDLRVATSYEDFASFARLARAYRAWLGVDLRSVQNIEQEVALLPGKYVAPSGCILLMSHKPPGKADAGECERGPDVACVAVRPLKRHRGEESYNSIADAADPSSEASATEESEQSSSPLPNALKQTDEDTTDESMQKQDTCELKRLWVDEQHQSQGLGKVLISAAFEVAKQMGYEKLVLDCLKSLTAANKLYEEAGFVRRKPYYYNPLPGELLLASSTVPGPADTKQACV